jgi:hypothetical protein
MRTIQLSYPKKSHRKSITIPEDSVQLAEFLGMLAGDGGMSNFQVTISLNSLLDREYPAYIADLGLKCWYCTENF